MPNVEVQALEQKAVLWAFSSHDNYGNVRVSAAAEIDVRWEQQTTEGIAADASPISVNGSVFVKQDIAEGSILWLGTLASLPVPVTSGLMEVIAFNKIPDIKGRVFQRTVTIKKYRDSLPTVV